MADGEVIAPNDLEAELAARVGRASPAATSPSADAPATVALPANAPTLGVPSDLEQQLTDRLRTRQQPVVRAENLAARLAAEERSLVSGARKQVPGPVPETLGPAGMGGTWADFWTRADLGLSDTFPEKKFKFMHKFPEGDFIQVPKYGAKDSYNILFRRNQNEQFAKLDAPLMDGLELFGDLADISGDIPAMALETIAIRGGRLATQMLRVALGTVAGDTAKEIIEEARGFQKQTFRERAMETTERAIFSAAGTAAMMAITGPINAIRGAPTIPLKPGAKEAMGAAEDLGMEPLLPTQLVRSPIIRKLTNQAAQLSGKIAEYIERQHVDAIDAMTRLRGVAQEKYLRGDLEALNADARRQILAAASMKGVSLTQGGTAIQQGIGEWDHLTGTIVNRAYAEARSIETPRFDLSSVLKTAEEIEARGLGQTTGRTVERVQEPLPSVRRRPTQTIEEPPDVMQLNPLQTGLNDVIADLRRIDPALPTVTRSEVVSDATEQLRFMRERLWELKTPNAGEIARREHKEAGKLYGAITHTLKNPTNAEEGFIESWARANVLAGNRFDTMDKLVVLKAGRSETPAILARDLAQPYQADNLRLLNNMWDRDPALFEAKRLQFKDAVKAEFLSPANADTLTRRLDSFDKETIDQLFNATEQKALRQTGEALDKLNALGIKGILAKQDQFKQTINELVIRPDTAAISELKRLAPDPDSRMGRNIRAGIVDHVLERSITTKDGVLILNQASYGAELKMLRDRGLLDFLTPADKGVLANIEKVLPFMPTPQDFGSSLFGGEAVSGLRSMKLSAFHTLLEAIGTGNLLTSRFAQRLMMGTGRLDLTPLTSIRAVGGILAQEANELAKENRMQ